MQQKIYDLIVDQEDITWKSIIHELVRTEQMDPWDINISLLTKKYIKAVKELHDHDINSEWLSYLHY